MNWQAAWFAEVEAFPSAVLAHRWPKVTNHGNMLKLPKMVARGEIKAPDILVGGTPCQAFSVAGKRGSLEDERGALTLAYVELLNEIDRRRKADGLDQAIAVWENVPGVLSTKDNAFGCFLAGLAGQDQPLLPAGPRWSNAGCVFGTARTVAWRILDAQYFGVAQRRRRVFVVASARSGFDPAAVLFEWGSLRRDTAPSRETGEAVTGSTPNSSASGKPNIGTLMANAGTKLWLGNQEALGGDYHILQPVAFDTTQITSAANYSNPQPGDACHPLSAGAHAPAIAFPANLSGTQCASAENIAPSMGAKNPTAVAYALQHAQIGRKDEAGPQGKGWQEEVAFTQDSRSCADAVAVAFPSNLSGTQCASTENLAPILGAMNPTAVAVSLRGREGGATAELGDEVQNCLRASSGGGGKPHVLTAMHVRRLTPVECERLQGFSDGYTDIPWTEYQRIQRRAEKAGASFEAELRKHGKVLRGPDIPACPDGPRYKALGNSWAVPCVAWIGRRIKQHLEAA
jgi:DNA (cytosine-5)-methyltransferase 1